jgi:hypothetical protein
MKIKVTFEKIFDAVEYTMSDDWEDCTFEEFKECLQEDFISYAENIVPEMKFIEIKENEN